MRTKIAVLLAVLLAGCGADLEEEMASANSAEQELRSQSGGTTTTTTKKTSSLPAYALRTTDAQSGRIQWKSVFPISTTYTLFVAMDLPATTSGEHELAVEVLLPSGSPYQRIVTRFATDVQASAGAVQAEITSKGYRVWVSLPVAGTWIEQYSLTGSWSANAFLDASATAAATSQFELQ